MILCSKSLTFPFSFLDFFTLVIRFSLFPESLPVFCFCFSILRGKLARGWPNSIRLRMLYVLTLSYPHVVTLLLSHSVTGHATLHLSVT